MITMSIKKFDETHLIVRFDDEAMRKTFDTYFSYKPKNVQYTPRYKAAKGKWDGMTKLYSVQTGKILSGLYWHIMEFAEDNKLNILSDYVPDVQDVSIDQVINYIDKLNIHSDKIAIETHDYQIEAIYHALKYNRALLLSPTSSGKSLIIYVLMRAYLAKKKRILIAVPSTMLVNQIVSDFEDYASEVSWDAEKACTKVFYGTEKDFDKPVVVGTWQSLVKLPASYLTTFDVIIADEAHEFKADVVSGLVKNCTNAKVRIGTTGTLDGKILSSIYLQGLFGATYKTISIRELIDRGSVAEPIIHCAVLKHKKETFVDLDVTDYHAEIDWIVSNPARMKFVTNLANKCKGNTVVLFQFVEKHGKPLYEMMKTHLKNKTIVYISGEVDLEDREDIKLLFREKENTVVLEFPQGTIKVSIEEDVKLTTGVYIKAKYIDHTSDICEKWIQKQLHT